MSNEDRELPESITAEYRAALHYENWEVDEFDITPETAMDILRQQVQHGIDETGEFTTHRGEPSDLTAADGEVLATEWYSSTHGCFWVLDQSGKVRQQEFRVTSDVPKYEDKEEFFVDNPHL